MTIRHATARDRFDYENNGRLTGDLVGTHALIGTHGKHFW